MADQDQQTRAFLMARLQRRPHMQVQDVFKALYQSVFGCEHMLAEESVLTERIRLEAAQGVPGPSAAEPLDGPYSRVHLSALQEGLAPQTLARLFMLSAKHTENAETALTQKLNVFLSCAAEGVLPFDEAAVRNAVQAWRAEGFPALHHSDAFHRHYAPAYRVVLSAYAHYLPLYALIDRLMAAGQRPVIAIDGGCSAGKTTLAAQLQTVYGCNVFHMDDFFLRPEQRTPERYQEPGGNVDRERFLKDVLLPVKTGKPFSFRRFDCGAMRLAPPQAVRPHPLSVVEGVYSLHPALRGHYDATVFLTIGPDLQARRILEREGAQRAPVFMQKWVPLENAYFLACSPQAHSDLVFEPFAG